MIKIKILDGFGSGLFAHVHRFGGGKSKHAGLLTLQERFLQFNPEVHPFLNDDFGTAMNQNVSFSGTPELIHDGGDAVGWTASIIAGTWDFADTTNPNAGTKCVSLTSANNADEAQFDDGATTDMSGFTALTGQMRLETYDATSNSILINFESSGFAVGNSVHLNDYIDTGVLNAYQGFVIPKADLGLTTQIIDEMDMVIVRTGGPRPVFRFDQLQWEQTGTPLVFTATTPADTRFHVTEIRIGLADDVTGIITGSTTTYPTMTGLAYNSLLGVSALSNGIIFARVQEDKTVFAVSLKQLSDFLATGSNLINMVSDGTNTFITLLVEFPEPIILDGSTGDNLSFTINDNLSGLLLFTAAARGAIEV